MNRSPREVQVGGALVLQCLWVRETFSEKCVTVSHLPLHPGRWPTARRRYPETELCKVISRLYMEFAEARGTPQFLMGSHLARWLFAHQCRGYRGAEERHG